MTIRPLEFDWLQNAVACKSTEFRVITRLAPAGGDGDKIFPPTYKHPEKNASLYAVEDRLIGGKPVRTVLLDSAASQANRIEEAILKAFDAKTCDIPVFLVTIPRSGGLQTRVTVLDAPHRITDAIFRDSDLNKIRFRESPDGARLFRARMENANAIFELCPTGLIFGYWDSQSEQGVLGAKVAKALVSEIVGFNAVSGRRTGSRIDPLLISSDAAKIYKNESDMWTLDEKQATVEKGKPKLYGKDTKAGKPSAINHGNVAPTVSKEDDPGGMTISEGLQTTVLSLPQIRRFKFPDPNTNKPSLDRDVAARSVLAALALYGIALQHEEGYFLRSRCHLIPIEPSRNELIGATAKEIEPFTLTVESARTTFQQSVVAAKKAGLSWRSGEIELTPTPKLVELVRRSDEKTQAEGVEDAGN